MEPVGANKVGFWQNRVHDIDFVTNGSGNAFLRGGDNYVAVARGHILIALYGNPKSGNRAAVYLHAAFDRRERVGENLCRFADDKIVVIGIRVKHGGNVKFATEP